MMRLRTENSGRVVLMYFAAGMFFLAAVLEMVAWYMSHKTVWMGMGAMFLGLGAMWLSIAAALKKKEARDDAADNSG